MATKTRLPPTLLVGAGFKPPWPRALTTWCIVTMAALVPIPLLVIPSEAEGSEPVATLPRHLYLEHTSKVGHLWVER